MNRRHVLGGAAVIGLLVVSVLADLAVGNSPPGQMAVFSLGSALVLIAGAKLIGGVWLSRPAGSRVGELGDPADDLDTLVTGEIRRG